MNSLFESQKLNKDGQDLVADLRANFESFSQYIMQHMKKPSRESSLALTKLEECSFYTIKAVCGITDNQAEPPLEEKLKI